MDVFKNLKIIRENFFNCLDTIEKYQAMRLKIIKPEWKKFLKDEKINKTKIASEIIFYDSGAIRKDYLFLISDEFEKLVICYNVYPFDINLLDVEYSKVSKKFENFVKKKLEQEDYFVELIEKIKYPYHQNFLDKINIRITYK